MPHGAVSSPREAVRLGFEMLRRGADSIYCSHSPYFIEAMAREGIPVTGHVGLVSNRVTWTNFRAIGKSADEALKVLTAVRDLDHAGAACLEVEQEMQAASVPAFRAFVADVNTGAYPASTHQVRMEEAAFERFMLQTQSL